jgi:hypothetical protein
MNANDKIFIGYLNLAERILRIQPNLSKQCKEFASFLFTKCLFALDVENLIESSLPPLNELKEIKHEFNPKNYVKCKSTDSRKIAYKIILSITRYNQNILSEILSENLLNLIKVVPIPTVWNYKPQLVNISG